MKIEYGFTFVPVTEQNSLVYINSSVVYDMSLGYGFAASSGPSKGEDLRASFPGDYFNPTVPSLFIDVPYGNYRVTVEIGDLHRASVTTLKAGLGSLVLDGIQTAPGQIVRESFAVHVDDGQLKLAIGGEAPAVRLLEIQRDPSIRTLFLTGDSTVTNQSAFQYPYTGWGQGIARWLNDGIAVSNHARSGASSKSFIEETRLNHIWDRIRPSDYLFIQFGHNDAKEDARGTEPFSTYQQYLRQYILGARSRQAFPVLVSPMHRRSFDEGGGIQNTHGDYIEAMRQLAQEEGIPYLDIASKSKRLFEHLGEEATKPLFMWIEPGIYPGLPDGVKDDTHFSETGSKAIAEMVAESIRDIGIESLTGLLRDRWL